MRQWVDPNSERAMKHWWRVYHRTAIFPKDQLRGLPSGDVVGKRADSCSGVYFLWRGPALLYVGQSVCVGTRLGQHEDAQIGMRRAKVIPFDRSTVLDLTDSEFVNTDRQRRALDAVELAYIRKFRPPYNVKGL